MALRTPSGDERSHVGFSRTHFAGAVALALATLLATSLAGCGGGERDKLATQTIATMEELNTVLDGVKDEPTAKAAAPKVNELVDRFVGEMDRLRKLSGAGASDPPAKAVGDKHEERFRTAARGIGLNLMAFRLDPGIRRQLGEPISRYDKVMNPAGAAPAGATP